MAQRVVDILARQFKKEQNKNFPSCTTDKIPVSGGKVGGAAKFPAFVAEQITTGKKIGLTAEEAKNLVQVYGSNVDKIFSRIGRLQQEALTYKTSVVLLAQLQYSIEEEMTLTPSDFFIRRTGALYFNVHWVNKWQQTVTTYMANYFQWDAITKEKYWQELQKHLLAVNPSLRRKRQDA